MTDSNAKTARLAWPGAYLLLALTMTGCAAGGAGGTAGGGAASASEGAPPSEEEQIAKMQVVDCLLPGQLRKLGNTTYVTPRRPIKTTAADCNIRGGEYVAHDRADYKTALKVWMPAAEAGDAKAQVNVGEIFEKGLGTEPNYEAAVIWYRKAAEQGNKRGLFNLGTMYEQGKGVEENRVKALNLYRQAWGLPQDSVIFQETARAERKELEKKLNKQIRQKEAQVQALRKQIDSLQAKLEASARNAEERQAMAAEIESLRQVVDSLRTSRDEAQQELASLSSSSSPEPASASKSGSDIKTREPERGDESRDGGFKDGAAPAATRVGDMDFGQYYALVIGNRDYSRIEDLNTPVNDAREIASLLEKRYGFRVELLIDADRLAIMKTINNLHDKLDENDNLLVYYAGHGSLVDVGKRNTGYWLPINADPPPDDSYWVPNEFVTDHLGRFNAKRVLVIADSCYGGLLSSAPGYLMLGDSSAKANEEYIRYKLPRRSRLLISSGGDKPVIDSAGDEHSIFAGKLIDILRDNDEILTVPELFAAIEEPVRRESEASGFPQAPVLKSIKGAGHEIGDFFFVPRSKTGASVALR
ncbi:hypothetical protein PC39_07599 [Salinisphaera sp. PC39]|uniref:caspase family protein n=1 Tax=Salinisphaera sp. PC39 TaxID=1304156 RepID=UPI0033422715